MTEPEQDPELLLAVIASDTESAALLTWATYASQAQAAGTLTFPVRTVDDLAPLFDAALDDGVAQDKVDLYRDCVPPAAFPLATFEELLRWTRLVIDLVHRLEDDPGRKWRRRH